MRSTRSAGVRPLSVLVELGVIALGRAAADDVLGRVDKDPVADVAGAGHQFSPVFVQVPQRVTISSSPSRSRTPAVAIWVSGRSARFMAGYCSAQLGDASRTVSVISDRTDQVHGLLGLAPPPGAIIVQVPAAMS